MSMQQLEKKWTPIEIEVLLKCYYINEPIFFDSDAYNTAIKKLFGCGLLIHSEQNSSIVKTSSKGIALVKLILSTEIPIQAWVDKYGNVIHEQHEL